ncbi:hypothetical protein Tco_0355249 [Tanacetum coccineum]
MPPRRFKKKAVKRIVEKRVAKAIEKYEKTRADSNNTGGSGSTNTGGTVVPEMHGCSYKTFTNGKPHSFNGTEGVVGLKRWFEKMEQTISTIEMLWEWRGIANMDFIQLGGSSRVDEMILAGEKYGSKTGCWLVLVLAGKLGKGFIQVGL